MDDLSFQLAQHAACFHTRLTTRNLSSSTNHHLSSHQRWDTHTVLENHKVCCWFGSTYQAWARWSLELQWWSNTKCSTFLTVHLAEGTTWSVTWWTEIPSRRNMNKKSPPSSPFFPWWPPRHSCHLVVFPHYQFRWNRDQWRHTHE